MDARIDPCTDEGYDAIRLTSPGGRLGATFVPSLNMIGSSFVHDGEELVYRRGGLAAYADRAKTCGIPLLHPWANRLGSDEYEAAGRRVNIAPGAARVGRDANGLAIHGLLGGRTAWDVIERRADAGAASIRACFRFDAPELLASFPFPHSIEIVAVLTDAFLEVSTSVRPASGTSVPVSFGWHPYFRLPSPRESWVVTMPVRRRVALDARMLPTGAFEDVHIAPSPLGARTFDDLFTDIGPSRTFAIADESRRLEVEIDERYPFVQVWAPEASPFVCIEPMTAAVAALTDARFAPPVVRSPDAFEAVFRVHVR